MSNTNNFTVIGQFQDEITSTLSQITSTITRITSTQERISRSFQRVTQRAERLELNPMNEDASDELTGTIRNALTEAKAFERIAEGLQAGAQRSMEMLKNTFSTLSDTIVGHFQSSIDDEISDIQASGSLFGGLQSAGILGAGDYGKAKEMAKELEVELATLNATSSAPASVINYFGRTLNDNLLPELMKGGQSIGEIAPKLATFYEQMALVNGAGDKTMASRSISKALNGAKEGELMQYDFFGNNSVLMGDLKAKGFFGADTVAERMSILMSSANIAMPQEAINEMRKTISGALSAWNDTLNDESIGILSFSRTFTKEQQKLFNTKATTPREIIAETLAPFINSFANLMARSYPIWAWAATNYELYVAPHVARATEMINEITAQDTTFFGDRLGQLAATLFNNFMNFFNNFSPGEITFFDKFIEGFNSLDSKIQWEPLVGKILTAISSTMKSIIGKVILTIVAVNVAWALTGALIQTFIAWAIPALLTFATGAMIPLLWTTFVAISTVILPIVALVAAVVVTIVRYREELMAIVTAVGEAIAGIAQIAFGVAQIYIGALSWPINKAVDLLVAGMQKMPLVGDLFEGMETNRAQGSVELMQTGINTIQAGADTFASSNLAGTVANLGIKMGQDTMGIITAVTNKAGEVVGLKDKAVAATVDVVESTNVVNETVTNNLTPTISITKENHDELNTNFATFEGDTTSALSAIGNSINEMANKLGAIRISSGGSSGGGGSMDLGGDSHGSS